MLFHCSEPQVAVAGSYEDMGSGRAWKASGLWARLLGTDCGLIISL